MNALFGPPSSSEVKQEPSRPRKRYTKEDLLGRFKQTEKLNMTVFESDRILEYADLFATSQEKPQFTSTVKDEKKEEAEEKDPFDDMMEEAKGADDKSGLLPESVKATQARPSVALQTSMKP